MSDILAKIPLVRALIRRFTQPVTPKPADVKDFWQFMQRRFGSQVIDKKNDIGMKIVAEALNLMGILDKETFLTKYTTTIGDKIYVPHPIGSDLPNWSLWSQIIICVHEHIHIVQDKSAGGLSFEWNYLTSTAARTMYEVDAYRSGMELNWQYQRRYESPKSIAAGLKNYACTVKDVKVAEKALSLAIPSIRAGALSHEVTRAAVEWLDVRFA